MSNNECKCNTLYYVDSDIFSVKKTNNSESAIMKEETDVKIIPASELTLASDFNMNDAIRKFNHYVSTPTIYDKNDVAIFGNPFHRLSLDEHLLSKKEIQLKQMIIGAGYTIKKGGPLVNCIYVSWPLPS